VLENSLIVARTTGTTQIERKPRNEAGQFYVATIDGIDVYAAEFEPRKAWLFSPYLLQSLHYTVMDEDHHVLRVSFQPGKDDLKGSLVTEFKLAAVWADWPIYEIDCEDPEMSS